MTTEIELRAPQSVTLTNDQLAYIAATDFVPQGLRRNLPAILACVATGRSLGLPDMTALRSIHIIDGKASFSAELMVMLVRKAGHSIEGTLGESKAVVTGTRADNGDTMTVTWTLAMAERADLVSKQNWKRYPEAMLWARAVSQLCRALFADCFAGGTYTAEELERSAGEPVAEHSEQSKPSVAGAVGEAESAALTASVSASSEDEAPSPAEHIAAAAEGLEPADLTDPNIPFGDAPEPIRPAQKKKLNVLVGKLRPDFCSTLDVWTDMATALDVDVDALIADRGGVDAGGVLHYSPLRDSLSKDEASGLIDRLETFARSKGLA